VRILGIDPGLVRTGFGVIDCHPVMRYVSSGTIYSKKGTFSERLGVIAQGVLEVVETFTPDEAAIEMVFVHQKSTKSALLWGRQEGLPLHDDS